MAQMLDTLQRDCVECKACNPSDCPGCSKKCGECELFKLGDCFGCRMGGAPEPGLLREWC